MIDCYFKTKGPNKNERGRLRVIREEDRIQGREGNERRERR